MKKLLLGIAAAGALTGLAVAQSNLNLNGVSVSSGLLGITVEWFEE